MYHGFSAGPWQYEFLAKRAFDAGYNVYVPRMPGHGLLDASGAVSARELPTGRTAYQYEAFAESSYQEAVSLGAPISVMGLSVGGAVALRVAERHPEVKRVVAYAPFLRPKSMGWLFDSARTVDAVPLNVGDGVLASVPWGWGSDCEAAAAAGKRAGLCSFTIGALNGALVLGDTVLKGSGELKMPVQFFVTGADDAAEEDAIRQAYVKSGGAARNGWYYYPKEEGIPHPMLHPDEDKGKGQTPALYDMTLRFLNGEVINRGEAPR
jgi:pimeloyl-ACP methyl ester carboxylesterase